jgi:hypothetical protein
VEFSYQRAEDRQHIRRVSHMSATNNATAPLTICCRDSPPKPVGRAESGDFCICVEALPLCLIGLLSVGFALRGPKFSLTCLLDVMLCCPSLIMSCFILTFVFIFIVVFYFITYEHPYQNDYSNCETEVNSHLWELLNVLFLFLFSFSLLCFVFFQCCFQKQNMFI